MIDRIAFRVIGGLLLVVLSIGVACVRQADEPVEPKGASEPAGRQANDDGDWRAIVERAKLERSFARFLEGLRASRVEGLPWSEDEWDRVDVYYKPYHDKAIALDGLLSRVGLTEKAGTAESPVNMEQVQRDLAELREMRYKLSQVVAEHVFGLDPEDETALGGAWVLYAIGEGHGRDWKEYSGDEPTPRQAEILSEMRRLYPELSDEYSFAWFLEALTRTYRDREIIERWDKVIDLEADYTSTAQTYGDLYWPYIQPKGLRQSPKSMREILDTCKKWLPEIQEQRFAISQAVLREVFGIEDQSLLDEVGAIRAGGAAGG